MKRHYVYQIERVDNGMRYIGVRSCEGEPQDDARYWSSSKYVLADVHLLGAAAFIKTVIAEFETREKAVAAEVAMHAELRVDERADFYNRAKQRSHKFDTSALVGEKNHFFGKSHSERTKQIIREKNVGKVGYWRDHPISQGTKDKLRAANLGKRASADTRRKMMAAHQGLFAGEKHPLFGSKSTAEANAKRREKLAGRPKSAETRAKMRDALIRRHRALGHRMAETTPE